MFSVVSSIIPDAPSFDFYVLIGATLKVTTRSVVCSDKRYPRSYVVKLKIVCDKISIKAFIYNISRFQLVFYVS